MLNIKDVTQDYSFSRNAVGFIIFLINASWPDVAFAVNPVNKHDECRRTIKRTVRYLKQTFGQMHEQLGWDADYARCIKTWKS